MEGGNVLDYFSNLAPLPSGGIVNIATRLLARRKRALDDEEIKTLLKKLEKLHALQRQWENEGGQKTTITEGPPLPEKGPKKGTYGGITYDHSNSEWHNSHGGDSGSGGGGGGDSGIGSKRAQEIEEQARQAKAEMDAAHEEANRRGIPIGQLFAERQAAKDKTVQPIIKPGGLDSDMQKVMIESMQHGSAVYDTGTGEIETPGGGSGGEAGSQSVQTSPGIQSLGINNALTPGTGNPFLNFNPLTGEMMQPTTQQISSLIEEGDFGGGDSGGGDSGGGE